MITKLGKLLTEMDFREGLLSHDIGIMICGDDPCTFISLEYVDHYKIYLSAFEEEAPNDHLIIVEAGTLEEAQKQAEIEMEKLVNSSIH